MKYSNIEQRKSEKGFTLVELAIVMIIIGVLLGGVLKGQEMITNAKITSTAKDMESFSAATNTFQDQYRDKPGTMPNANSRLANCATLAACFDVTAAMLPMPRIGTAQGNNATTAFFGQLLAAGLISGFDGSNNGAAANFGTSHPAAPVDGGGFIVGNSFGTAVANSGFAGVLATGRFYLGLSSTTAVMSAGQGVVTAEQASVIDTRLDDRNPQTGYILGQNLADNCVLLAGDTTYTGGALPCVIIYRL